MARARHSGSMCVAVAPSWPVRGVQPSASCSAPVCVACFRTAASFPPSTQIFLVSSHDRPGLGTRGLAVWAEVKEMATGQRPRALHTPWDTRTLSVVQAREPRDRVGQEPCHKSQPAEPCPSPAFPEPRAVGPGLRGGPGSRSRPGQQVGRGQGRWLLGSRL